MEVDNGGLAQQLGCPVLVVSLGRNGQNVREREARLVVGDQLGALRVVSVSSGKGKYVHVASLVGGNLMKPT